MLFLIPISHLVPLLEFNQNPKLIARRAVRASECLKCPVDDWADGTAHLGGVTGKEGKLRPDNIALNFIIRVQR